MCNVPCYNPTICSHLHGYSLEKYFKTGKKTDMILWVILTHMTSSTIKYDLIIWAVIMEFLWQLFHQHNPLHPLVIHCTLLTNGFNALSPTIILEFKCKMIKYESSSRHFLSLFHNKSLKTTRKRIRLKSRHMRWLIYW